MKSTEKLISFFKRLESLSNDEWIELDLNMNELVHNEKKDKNLKEMIETSKKQLNEQERYAFEASLHRSATNIFVHNSKTNTEERVSLYLIPVSLVWNDGVHRKVEHLSEYNLNIDSILKKYKLISKKSQVHCLNHWISFNQLEQSSVKDLSDYLKDFIQTEDVLNLSLPTVFSHEEGEALYIPLIITESVFDDNVFIDNYDNLNVDQISEITELISNQISTEDCLIIPDRISEFHEALSMTKSMVFVDEILYHLEQARTLKTPIKNIYLIKQNDRIVFSATDDKNEEIYNISILSNSERILTEILESSLAQLEYENQVKQVDSQPSILKFTYIGNLN